MARILCFLYGIVAYLCFQLSILYAIGFVAGQVVPKHIDSGEPGPVVWSIMINLLLLAVFAVQHTIMARPAFKVWWTNIIPEAIERSTFVLVASLILMLIFWQWRPLPGIVWNVEQPIVANLLLGISLAGWALVFYSSFLIDHFDLFGLRQVYFHLRGLEYHHPPFAERAIYQWIRHPLMAGFLVAVWFTPTMTYGHLLFSAGITAYIFIGIQFEERDLLKILGPSYAEYRTRTPMIFPWRVPSRETSEGQEPEVGDQV